MRDERGMEFDTYVQEHLFDRRVVLMQGQVDDALATRTAAQLLTLEALADKPIRMHLAAPGGELGAVLSLVDTIGVLGVELTAVAVGEVSGAAVAVLAAAPVRAAYPHARFALGEPRSTELNGTATQIESIAREQLRMRDCLVELLAAATGRQAEAVSDDLRRGRFLTAQEALGYGLVGSVVTPGGRPATGG